MRKRNRETIVRHAHRHCARACMSLLAALALAGASGCLAPDRTAWEQGRIHEITDAAQFENHAMNAPHPVMAVFHSPNCPHCRSLLRTLPGLADEFHGHVAFLTIDVTQARDLQAMYGVRKVPTVLFLRQGQVVGRREGSRPRFLLRRDIAKLNV